MAQKELGDVGLGGFVDLTMHDLMNVFYPNIWPTLNPMRHLGVGGCLDPNELFYELQYVPGLTALNAHKLTTKPGGRFEDFSVEEALRQMLRMMPNPTCLIYDCVFLPDEWTVKYDGPEKDSRGQQVGVDG